MHPELSMLLGAGALQGEEATHLPYGPRHLRKFDFACRPPPLSLTAA